MSQVTLDQALQMALGHHQAGRLQEAEAIYRQILVVQPKQPDALHLLGMIASQLGRHDVAMDLIRQAIAIAPNPEYSSNLGSLLQTNGQLDQAILCYRQALELKPDYPEALSNLGAALMKKGLLDQAITCFQRALELRPNYPNAHNNLGTALKEKGRLEEAIVSYRQALTLKPDYIDACNNLGNTLMRKNQIDQAIACYQQAMTLNPDLSEAHNNLGSALLSKGQLNQATACYQRALTINPNNSEALSNLGNALKEMGQLDEAIVCYRQAMALDPLFISAHDNLLYILPFHPASDSQSLFAEAQRWNHQFAQSLKPFIRPHSNDRNPERRLRIGYVSPDFRDHPVGRFILPLLTSHDRNAFQVFCYAQVAASDATTAKLQSQADTWRSIIGLFDEQAAGMIRQDQIDILVDLTMHMANNRLLIFARKPAPVQVTYLAYVGGTGLDTIDYRLTDRHLDPHEADDQYYLEKSFRLEGTYWCYQPNTVTPPVNELPALTAGKITFGCLNNFCKVTQPTLETWASLLRRLPDSRLLLHTLAGGHCDRLMRFLEDRGIAPDRLEMAGDVSPQEYFRTYCRIDIALDPFPYSGGTTTCDALWMGVPVVTLSGRTAVGRAGVSILSNAGLPELIAQTPDQYIQIATDLANDLPHLAELRSTLRQRMQASPLMDARSYASGIEAAYRTMWRNWCTV